MKLKVGGVLLGLAVFATVAGLALAGVIPAITVAPKDSAGTVTISVIQGGDVAGQTISALSWSVGISKDPNAAVSPHDFTITKLIDKATPNLFLASATGRALPEVDLVLNRPGAPAGTPFMSYRLTNVLVTSDVQSESGSDRPTETITLHYDRIDQLYTTSDGETVETLFTTTGS